MMLVLASFSLEFVRAGRKSERSISRRRSVQLHFLFSRERAATNETTNKHHNARPALRDGFSSSPLVSK